MTDFALTIATRRGAICLGLAAILNLALPGAASAAADGISKRFRFLAENGNSNCSQSFLASIASMPDAAAQTMLTDLLQQISTESSS